MSLSGRASEAIKPASLLCFNKFYLKTLSRQTMSKFILSLTGVFFFLHRGRQSANTSLLLFNTTYQYCVRAFLYRCFESFLCFLVEERLNTLGSSGITYVGRVSFVTSSPFQVLLLLSDLKAALMQGTCFMLVCLLSILFR